jgi:hypothetical protein
MENVGEERKENKKRERAGKKDKKKLFGINHTIFVLKYV